MPKINNIEFLTLPQQVMKNKRDVATLQTEVANNAVSTAGEFSNVYIGLNDLKDRVDEAEDIIEELLTATEDTGWQPLELTNASVNMSTTKMFIRKMGNVVALAGMMEFSSAYVPYPPGAWLVQLPLEYRPIKRVEGLCIKYVTGARSETTFVIETDGYLKLTTAQGNSDVVEISGFTYFAQ